MSVNQPVHRIAIVGTAVIGASWAAYYLACGFEVVATDPGPQAEANLRKYVDDACVADADVAVCYGPGIRWGVRGPSLQWHVGGGQGGIQYFMEHLMDPLAAMMKTLDTPEIRPQLKQTESA